MTDLTTRNRLANDPLRNFKFHVSISHPTYGREIANMGFTSAEGLNMSTEMIPYREGGWNTNPHKMPGMTDFSPITLSSGVFNNRTGMWNMAKQMFAVQWGNGTLRVDDDYRFDLMIRVYDHPVTLGEGALVRNDTSRPMLAFRAVNAWVANVAFGGLNAMENSILIHQLTLHHEGLGVWFNEGKSSVNAPESF
jgi:phage tail-like protein